MPNRKSPHTVGHKFREGMMRPALETALGDLDPDEKITLRPHRAGRIDTTPRELMAQGRFKPFMTVGQVEFAFSRD